MKFKNFLILSIPACIMGFVMSFLMSKFLIGLPPTEIANAINNGLSGLISTLIGFIMTYLINKEKFTAISD